MYILVYPFTFHHISGLKATNTVRCIISSVDLAICITLCSYSALVSQKPIDIFNLFSCCGQTILLIYACGAPASCMYCLCSSGKVVLYRLDALRMDQY